MANYSLFDVIQPSQPAMFDVYDMPNAGPAPSPTPQTQAAMGGASPNWISALAQLAQQGGAQTPPQASAPARPPTAAMPLRSPQTQSQKGFGGNSRKGFDMQSLMTLASLYAGGAGAMGAMGGGGAGGMTGGMNPMSMMGGMGGGGSPDARPNVSYAPLPEQSGPLVPQSVAQWQATDTPWLFRG